MDDGFIGEIRLIPYTFVPEQWFLCQGQNLVVQQYPALYAVIGNTYGGTAPHDFNLPNLVGSVAICVGQQSNTTPYTLAQTGGTNSVTIDDTTMANHNHIFNGAVGGGKFRTSTPAGNTSYLTNFAYKLAATDTSFIPALGYAASTGATTPVTLNSNIISPVGSGQSHENRQPFTNLVFCICWSGAFPTPSND